MHSLVSAFGVKLRIVALALVAAAFLAPAAEAKRPATPAEWVKDFWPTAKAGGISRRVYDSALGDFTPDPDVIRKAQTQAEFNTKIWDYLDMMVSTDRLSEGKA